MMLIFSRFFFREFNVLSIENFKFYFKLGRYKECQA